MLNDGLNTIENRISIAQVNSEVIDSVLFADSFTDVDRANQSYNINYRYDDRDKQRSFNVDLDYGSYDTESFRTLPNIYYDAALQNVLTTITNYYDTPTYIDILYGEG